METVSCCHGPVQFSVIRVGEVAEWVIAAKPDNPGDPHGGEN